MRVIWDRWLDGSQFLLLYGNGYPGGIGMDEFPFVGGPGLLAFWMVWR